MALRRLLVWASLGAVGAACPPPGNSRPPDDAGTSVFVGRQCSVDAECGGLRCDRTRRQCICLSDESCRSAEASDPPRYCNNYTGLCVTEISGCTKSSDCADMTSYCDSSIRTCRPLKGFCEPCGQDFECGGALDNCVVDATLGQRFCAKACSTAIDCPRGAACVEGDAGTKQCWPAPNPLKPQDPVTCRNFKGCTPDTLTTCNSNDHCAAVPGQRCDRTRGKCTAVDQVCPFGTVCDPRDKICVVECSADPDCGDPRLRCTNRVCEPIGECRKDTDCPPNKVCGIAPGQTIGECRPRCRADGECPLGELCGAEDGGNVCRPGCSLHADCPVEKRCDLPRRACEGPMVGGVRVCQTTATCGRCEECGLGDGGLVCRPGRASFPHCVSCTANSDCAGGECVMLDDGNRYCGKFCGVGQECPQGFVCLPVSGGANSVCVPADRSCAGKCP